MNTTDESPEKRNGDGGGARVEVKRVVRRFFLKTGWQKEWQEVSRDEYIRAERAAGFRSKFGPDHPATGAFSSGSVSGKTWA